MPPDIWWITPLYGFGPDCDHIGVPESARAALQEMANELVGTRGLVVIYIPGGTEDVYKPGGMRGRVVGAVRLVNMPRRRRMEDYYYDDCDRMDHGAGRSAGHVRLSTHLMNLSVHSCANTWSTYSVQEVSRVM